MLKQELLKRALNLLSYYVSGLDEDGKPVLETGTQYMIRIK